MFCRDKYTDYYQATILAGRQCSKRATCGNYCGQHDRMYNRSSYTDNCQATTLVGNPCSRRATRGNFCRQHVNSATIRVPSFIPVSRHVPPAPTPVSIPVSISTTTSMPSTFSSINQAIFDKKKN